MALAGRRALVAGGAGVVGSGIVHALLKEGAEVIVTSRSPANFEKLKQTVQPSVRDKLSVIVADVSTEEGAKTIFNTATKQDVHHIVASIGSFWQKGRLEDQTVAELHLRIKDAVVGHFLLFKVFAPYLDKIKGSSYTIITGNAGSKYIAPKTSLLCVGSGAVNGLAVAAVAENKSKQVAVGEFKIQLLVHNKPDSEMQKDDVNLGNDLVGQAVVATIRARSRVQTNIYNRQDTKAVINSNL